MILIKTFVFKLSQEKNILDEKSAEPCLKIDDFKCKIDEQNKDDASFLITEEECQVSESKNNSKEY